MTITQEAINEIKATEDANQPHWRLMYRKESKEVFIACLQSFDYYDYADCGFVNEKRYKSEEEAKKDWNVGHFYA